MLSPLLVPTEAAETIVVVLLLLLVNEIVCGLSPDEVFLFMLRGVFLIVFFSSASSFQSPH